MEKNQIAISKRNKKIRFNSLSEKVRKLLDSIDHQTLIDKAEQWLLSLRKNQRNDLFERYFDKGFSLTELEDYAVFVALAEKVCRDHVNRYLYPLDEPLGAKRVPIDSLKSEIDDCPDDWITLFEAIICRIAKRHSVELPESIQQDAPDEALMAITVSDETMQEKDKVGALQESVSQKPAGAGQGNKVGEKPNKEAIQAYQILGALGCTQIEAAKIMTGKLKHQITQGQVSRWNTQCEKFLTANDLEGFSSDLKSDTVAVDPAKLDMGARTDGKRTGDPRHKKLVDHDNAAYDE